MPPLHPWQAALIIYFIGGTAFSLGQRRMAQVSKVPLNLVAALVFATVVYPAGILYALLLGDFWVHLNWVTVALVAGVGLTLGSFNAFAFWLNKHVDATQYLIVSNLYTPLTVLLGVVLLHEAFGARQALGMLLLLVGAMLVAVKGVRPSTWRLNSYTLLIAVASVLMGVGLVMERASLDHMSLGAYLAIGYASEGLVTLVWSYRELRLVPTLTRSDWKDILRLGVARAGHILGFVAAVSFSRNVALIATVSSFRIPLVFIASYLILRERENPWRKLAGVAIATVGLVLT